MSIIKKLNTPFFLTGGTALSRHYFNHRYSDDLDLFVISDDQYSEWMEKILSVLFEAEKKKEIMIDRKSIKRLKDYAQVFIHLPNDANTTLKIDFINDTAPHYGNYEEHITLGKIDSWRNILSNKICALFRLEPKDIADIWIISKEKSFNWTSIIEEAKTKEVGVEVDIIYNILRSFPIEKFDILKCVKTPEYTSVKKEIDIIAEDIFYGRDNSLFNYN